MQDPAGEALLAEFGARFTPTFIYFDSTGVERWREIGSVDPESVRQSLAQDSSNG